MNKYIYIYIYIYIYKIKIKINLFIFFPITNTEFKLTWLCKYTFHGENALWWSKIVVINTIV